MRALKAIVRGGQFVIDEPASLPDGTEVELMLDEDDELDPEERARLDQALEEAEREIECGECVDGAEVIDELGRRHASIDRGLADVRAGRTVDARDLIEELRARSGRR